ncbi:MAG: pentapeptide repeat-containing protein [Nodosilinea sp.]
MRTTTSKEILSLYKKGKRDFCNLNLSGQNFRKSILSGADFSFSNIQNTSFKSADLTNTKFVCAKAGIDFITTFIWASVSFGASFILGFLVSLSTINLIELILKVQGIRSYPISLFVSIAFLTAIAVLVFLTSLFGKLTSDKGMTIRKFIARSNTLLGLGLCLGIIFIIFFLRLDLEDLSFYLSSLVTGLLLGIVFQFLTTGIATAKSITFIVTGSLLFCRILLIVCLLGILLPVWIYKLQSSFVFLILVLLSGIISIWIGAYSSHGAVNGDPLWAGTLRAVISLLSRFSTNFEGATLDGADFSGSSLKITNLKLNRIPLQVKWSDAYFLKWARLSNTLLEDLSVRSLLVSENGRDKTYIGKNLKGANLAGADLVGADFTEADLSQATLEGSNLQCVNFKKVQALGTQFHRADLTGACIEAWNIDSTTQLGDVVCDYVYLLESQQERRPSSGVFQSGEFAKLFEEVLDTIDLIFQNGIDWRAFVKTYEKVQVNNDETDLTIQSIENKGDGVVVVRVDVPKNTNKEKIHSEFKQIYEDIRQQFEAQYKQRLNAKDREIEIYEHQSVQMWSVINRLAERPPVSTTENILGNKVVNDQSQNFQGNVNINAHNSVVNLRDISGQVSNQINQLPTESTPDQPSLKDLLASLQNAVEADNELGEDEKIEALAEVGELANAAQSPKEGVMKKSAKGAMNALKGIAASLSDASKLASACKELLPLIMTAFGLP